MSHALKQHALEAYVGGRLSVAGARRVERHLVECSLCSQALPQLRAYARLREEAADEQSPLLAWERLEAALDAAPAAPDAPHERAPSARRLPAQKPATPGKWIALAWPVLAVAATLVIAWIGLSGSPGPQPDATAPVVAISPPALPSGVGRVTLVAGEVWLAHQGARTRLGLGSEVPEGARVITAANASVHVVLGDGTGFALAADGNVQLEALRAGSVDLALEHGDLANQVHKLTPDQHYVVRFGALSARVRGTRFVIEQPARDARFAARVSVHEGKVEVAEGARVLALLGPGQAYASPNAPADQPAAKAAAARSIHAIEAQPEQQLDAWGTLSLPPLAELRAWIIDGERIAPQGGLQLRLPRGRAELQFEDARGQLRSITLDLRERETQLEPGALAKLVAPKEMRVGTLEPEQITQVIRAGVESLRRCYERGLRVVPSLQGKLTLSMRVGADGRVQRAEPQSHELPAEVARCISQEALRLVFPKPDGGGAVSFDVPLNLRSR